MQIQVFQQNHNLQDNPYIIYELYRDDWFVQMESIVDDLKSAGL